MALAVWMTDHFLLDTPVAIALYEEFARPQPIIDYHNHLSPQLIADDHRFRSITRAVAGRRPLQVARDARRRRARARHHRRRVGLGEVRGLGGHRPPDPSQPALSLDAPRARVPVRRARPAPRARHGARDLRPLQRAARRGGLHDPGAAAPVRRARRLHHRRPGRRSGAAPAARRQPARVHEAAADLASRSGARGARSVRLEHLGRSAGGGVGRRDRAARGPARRAGPAARGVSRARLPRVRSWAGPRPRRARDLDHDRRRRDGRVRQGARRDAARAG